MRFLGFLIVALEWFSHAVCVTFVDSIGRVFFYSPDSYLQMIFVFSAYAVAFIGRPIGASFFGWYSDVIGRGRAIFLAFFMMTLSTLCLSLLPGSQVIGIWAPALFILFRFFQGVAIAGSYGVTVLNIEAAPRSERYFVSSTISLGFMMGFMFGNLSSALIFYFMPSSMIESVGWRIPLWVSCLLSLIVLIHFPIKEFVHKKRNDLIGDFDLRVFLKACIVLLLDMFCFYLCFVFIPTYKVSILGQPAFLVVAQAAVGMFLMAAFTPFFGKMADAYGGVRNLRYGSLLFLAIAFFAPWKEAFWLPLFGVVLALCYSSLYAWVALIFPLAIRARASSLAVNLMAVFVGGVTPIICALLGNINIRLVGIMLFVVAFLVYCVLYKEPEIHI
jgi:MHS family proline/betaine transporter-like MFS transporter